MFALVILAMFVAVIMFRRRVFAVKKGEIEISHFKTYDQGRVPALVLQADRHYSNLFELPVLFYVGCLAAMMLPQAGFFLYFWAWVFVFARYAHAFIHLQQNQIRPRMLAFLLGYVAILGFWITLVWRVTLMQLL